MLRYVPWWRRYQVEECARSLSRAMWLLSAAMTQFQRLGDAARAASMRRLIVALRAERQQWLAMVDSPLLSALRRRGF